MVASTAAPTMMKKRRRRRREKASLSMVSAIDPPQTILPVIRFITNGLLKNPDCRLLKKISEARRAKNRRAEAYIGSTLTRGD